MYLLSALHGQATSASPGFERRADGVDARHERPVAQHVEGGLAHAGHDPHRHRDVRRVGELARRCRQIGEPSGPIEKGTTYIVRPFMQPANRPLSLVRISAGSAQLFVGPASALVFGADEGAVFDAGDVAGVGEGEVAVRPLGVGQLGERAGVRPVPGRGVRIPRPSRRTTRCGRAWSSPAMSLTQLRRAVLVERGVAPMSGLDFVVLNLRLR